MLSMYPACFFKEEKGYSVVFPDLNWLATYGETEEEAMEMAAECLAGYLFTLKQDGDAIPKASNRKDISIHEIAKELDADEQDAFVNVISVDVELSVNRTKDSGQK